MRIVSGEVIALTTTVPTAYTTLGISLITAANASIDATLGANAACTALAADALGATISTSMMTLPAATITVTSLSATLASRANALCRSAMTVGE